MALSTRTSNNGPIVRWHRNELANGTIRHRLFVGDRETAFFVDDSRKAGIGHWMDGSPIGVLGSGMGREMRCRNGSTYRIAALLYPTRNLGSAKARAEQLALAD